MSDKPEALRLADEMTNYFNERGPDAEAIAAELRRLHALNAELVEALREMLENGGDFAAKRDKARAALAKVEAQR